MCGVREHREQAQVGMEEFLHPAEGEKLISFSI